MPDNRTATTPFSDTERKFAAVMADERCWSLALETRVPDSVYETLDQYRNEVLARHRECREQGLPGFEFEPRRWLDLVRHLSDKNPKQFPRLGVTMGHEDEPRPGPSIEDAVIVCQILAKLAGEGPEPAMAPNGEPDIPRLSNVHITLLMEITGAETPDDYELLTTEKLIETFSVQSKLCGQHKVRDNLKDLERLGLIFRNDMLRGRWDATARGKQVAGHYEVKISSQPAAPIKRPQSAGE